ncbi:hypothetical protein [Chryseobacterium sp. JV274]|uniref:hypothetical protein n=1 Tax=Chryseobacterium sp. JV274 TaxID=1932669 RepID=UPI000985CDF9|nr:hypothetical protein [Chryseobacterium sp. JV274]
MISFEIKVSVYKTNIHVIIGGTYQEKDNVLWTKGYEKCYREQLLDRITDHDATAVEHKSGDLTLFFNESPKKDNFWLSILTHETLHAACYILRRVGVQLSEESEEAYAYLQQMIFEEILDNLDNG